MTITYLINYDLHKNSGVIQKIKQQALEWGKQSHIVYFVSMKTMRIYDEKYNILYEEKSLKFDFGRFSTALKLLYHTYRLPKLLEKIEFDMIYMRYQLYMPFMSRVLESNKVVMEINSDDTMEYRLHSQLTNVYNRLTRNDILRHVDAFVAVSNELKEMFLYLDKPIKVIANGISSQEYPLKKNRNEKPILVFIGTPKQSWHGLDKIMVMAKHFKKYQFYIIGADGKDSDNMKYFGYLTKEESTNIIKKCDAGIGTLSLYEKGLREASPLKTRQYLACGLPIIYAYKDTDLSSEEHFGLRLENSENNLDFDKIEKFIQRVFRNSEINIEAKKFASEALDYSKKEKIRVSFFKEVISG